MKWIKFKPLYMERVWGGNHLASIFGRDLAGQSHIGESWEIVDRPEAQSIGTLNGKVMTLREMILSESAYIMGPKWDSYEQFPILVKLLDCNDRLSAQVHPTEKLAARFGGESKDELWYIMNTTRPDAQLYVGLKRNVTREQFEDALRSKTLEKCLHAVHSSVRQSIFVPSGRLHAIDAGNVILEIQKNSDTTYRVYDWDRLGLDGKPRQLHVEQSLESIDFGDYEPQMTPQDATGCIANSAFFDIVMHDLPEDESLHFQKDQCTRLLHVVEGTVYDDDCDSALSRGCSIILPFAENFNFKGSLGAKILITHIH